MSNLSLVNGMKNKALDALRKMGCVICSVKRAPARPVIEIEYPSHQLRAMAVEMQTEVNGLKRRVYAAGLCGAMVYWQEFDELELITAELYLLDKANVAI